MRENKKPTIVGGSPEFFIFAWRPRLPSLRLVTSLSVILALIAVILFLLSPSPSILRFTVNGKPMMGAQAHYGQLFPNLEQPVTELENGVFLVDKFEYKGKAKLVVRHDGWVRLCRISPQRRITYDKTGNENGAGYISTRTETRYHFGVFPWTEVTTWTLYSDEKNQQYADAGLTLQQIEALIRAEAGEQSTVVRKAVPE